MSTKRRGLALAFSFAMFQALAIGCLLIGSCSPAGEETYTYGELDEAMSHTGTYLAGGVSQKPSEEDSKAVTESLARRMVFGWFVKEYLRSGVRVYCDTVDIPGEAPTFSASPAISFLKMTAGGENSPQSLNSWDWWELDGQQVLWLRDKNGRSWIIDPGTVVAFETLMAPRKPTPEESVATKGPGEELEYGDPRKKVTGLKGISPKDIEYMEKRRAVRKKLREHLPGCVNIYFTGEAIARRRPAFSAVLLSDAIEIMGQTFVVVEKDFVPRWLINSNCAAFENLDRQSATVVARPKPVAYPQKVNIYCRGENQQTRIPCFTAVANRRTVAIFGRAYVEIEDAKGTSWLVNMSGARLQSAETDSELRSDKRVQKIMIEALKEVSKQVEASGEKDPEKKKRTFKELLEQKTRAALEAPLDDADLPLDKPDKLRMEGIEGTDHRNSSE